MTHTETTKYVAWARGLNDRWIVHRGLGERADAYLNHLAKADPERLERSCQLAHELARQSGNEDPKPWFYAGLFSLASVEEAKKFLANRWFTLLAIPSLPSELCSTIPLGTIGPAAQEKIKQIRQALTNLLASH